MPALSVHGLKTDMDRGFSELKTELTELKTDLTELKTELTELKTELKAEMREEHVETRRHFDVVAEQLRTDMKLMVEGCYSRLDNHEGRIQTLEKRRR